MRGYGQFCPVAKASEVIAERWTPLILRELLSGTRRFNDLQRGVPLMSRSLLAKRLRELEDAGVIEQRPSRSDRRASEYHLTRAGEELRSVIESLGVWGQRWVVKDVEEDDLDPSLLMWDIRRNLVPSEPPDQRVVVRFDLIGTERARARWWLLVDAHEVDLCMTNPGFDIDLVVEASLKGLTRYWIGRASWKELLQGGEVELSGPRWLRNALPEWLRRSAFAGVQPASAVP